MANNYLIIKPCIYILTFILLGCNTGNPDPTLVGRGSDCKLEDYTLAKESPFVLPYEVGKEFRIEAGNCGGVSHSRTCNAWDMLCGDQRYAADFTMPIGTPIVATRDGIVVTTEDRYNDVHSTGRQTNYVFLEHSDGTASLFLHLKKKGVFVGKGESVKQGEVIALSGNSGWVGNSPHLHLVVFQNVHSKCSGPIQEGCISIPVTFRNAQPLDTPLIEGKTYKAVNY